ncbi:MAG: translation initiation factor IF-3 [Desulfurivibrionaceae bacterium]
MVIKKRGGKEIKKKKKLQSTREVKAKVNAQIDAPEVRVIKEDGEQLGILTRAEAQEAADEAGLDLVEVSAKADPPVCRIMDYGKYRYEESKKQAQAKKKQAVVEVKEIKIRPKTEKHDIDFKVNNIRKFLSQNNKVKVTMRFRGREIIYADTLGKALMDQIIEQIEDVGEVQQGPMMEGRQLVMFVLPGNQSQS